MNSIVSLVSSHKDLPLLPRHLDAAASCLGSRPLTAEWLTPRKALDLVFSGPVDKEGRARLEARLMDDKIDFFIIPDDGRRRKKLLVADMDNTMVVGETLDELAGQCGLKEKIAVITEQAMQGELDFMTALRLRVALLRGLPETALQTILAAIKPMAGAEKLVKTMADHGARCILVSGGFSCFTETVAAKLGFHVQHGNTVEIKGGKLTGKVLEPIIDHRAKLGFLQHYRAVYQLDREDTLAVGDGANDLAMIGEAGLGVGYHPKAFLKERVVNNILHGDLTALLYLQGYREV